MADLEFDDFFDDLPPRRGFASFDGAKSWTESFTTQISDSMVVTPRDESLVNGDAFFLPPYSDRPRHTDKDMSGNEVDSDRKRMSMRLDLSGLDDTPTHVNGQKVSFKDDIECYVLSNNINSNESARSNQNVSKSFAAPRSRSQTNQRLTQSYPWGGRKKKKIDLSNLVSRLYPTTLASSDRPKFSFLKKNDGIVSSAATPITPPGFEWNKKRKPKDEQIDRPKFSFMRKGSRNSSNSSARSDRSTQPNTKGAKSMYSNYFSDGSSSGGSSATGDRNLKTSKPRSNKPRKTRGGGYEDGSNSSAESNTSEKPVDDQIENELVKSHIEYSKTMPLQDKINMWGERSPTSSFNSGQRADIFHSSQNSMTWPGDNDYDESISEDIDVDFRSGQGGSSGRTDETNPSVAPNILHRSISPSKFASLVHDEITESDTAILDIIRAPPKSIEKASDDDDSDLIDNIIGNGSIGIRSQQYTQMLSAPNIDGDFRSDVSYADLENNKLNPAAEKSSGPASFVETDDYSLENRADNKEAMYGGITSDNYNGIPFKLAQTEEGKLNKSSTLNEVDTHNSMFAGRQNNLEQSDVLHDLSKSQEFPVIIRQKPSILTLPSTEEINVILADYEEDAEDLDSSLFPSHSVSMSHFETPPVQKRNYESSQATSLWSTHSSDSFDKQMNDVDHDLNDPVVTSEEKLLAQSETFFNRNRSLVSKTRSNANLITGLGKSPLSKTYSQATTISFSSLTDGACHKPRQEFDAIKGASSTDDLQSTDLLTKVESALSNAMERMKDNENEDDSFEISSDPVTGINNASQKDPIGMESHAIEVNTDGDATSDDAVIFQEERHGTHNRPEPSWTAFTDESSPVEDSGIAEVSTSANEFAKSLVDEFDTSSNIFDDLPDGFDEISINSDGHEQAQISEVDIHIKAPNELEVVDPIPTENNDDPFKFDFESGINSVHQSQDQSNSKEFEVKKKLSKSYSSAPLLPSNGKSMLAKTFSEFSQLNRRLVDTMQNDTTSSIGTLGYLVNDYEVSNQSNQRMQNSEPNDENQGKWSTSSAEDDSESENKPSTYKIHGMKFSEPSDRSPFNTPSELISTEDNSSLNDTKAFSFLDAFTGASSIQTTKDALIGFVTDIIKTPDGEANSATVKTFSLTNGIGESQGYGGQLPPLVGDANNDFQKHSSEYPPTSDEINVISKKESNSSDPTVIDDDVFEWSTSSADDESTSGTYEIHGMKFTEPSNDEGCNFPVTRLSTAEGCREAGDDFDSCAGSSLNLNMRQIPASEEYPNLKTANESREYNASDGRTGLHSTSDVLESNYSNDQKSDLQSFDAGSPINLDKETHSLEEVHELREWMQSSTDQSTTGDEDTHTIHGIKFSEASSNVLEKISTNPFSEIQQVTDRNISISKEFLSQSFAGTTAAIGSDSESDLEYRKQNSLFSSHDSRLSNYQRSHGFGDTPSSQHSKIEDKNQISPKGLPSTSNSSFDTNEINVVSEPSGTQGISNTSAEERNEIQEWMEAVSDEKESDDDDRETFKIHGVKFYHASNPGVFGSFTRNQLFQSFSCFKSNNSDTNMVDDVFPPIQFLSKSFSVSSTNKFNNDFGPIVSEKTSGNQNGYTETESEKFENTNGILNTVTSQRRKSLAEPKITGNLFSDNLVKIEPDTMKKRLNKTFSVPNHPQTTSNGPSDFNPQTNDEWERFDGAHVNQQKSSSHKRDDSPLSGHSENSYKQLNEKIGSVEVPSEDQNNKGFDSLDHGDVATRINDIRPHTSKPTNQYMNVSASADKSTKAQVNGQKSIGTEPASVVPVHSLNYFTDDSGIDQKSSESKELYSGVSHNLPDQLATNGSDSSKPRNISTSLIDCPPNSRRRSNPDFADFSWSINVEKLSISLTNFSNLNNSWEPKFDDNESKNVDPLAFTTNFEPDQFPGVLWGEPQMEEAKNNGTDGATKDDVDELDHSFDSAMKTISGMVFDANEVGSTDPNNVYEKARLVQHSVNSPHSQRDNFFDRNHNLDDARQDKNLVQYERTNLLSEMDEFNLANSSSKMTQPKEMQGLNNQMTGDSHQRMTDPAFGSSATNIGQLSKAVDLNDQDNVDNTFENAVRTITGMVFGGGDAGDNNIDGNNIFDGHVEMEQLKLNNRNYDETSAKYLTTVNCERETFFSSQGVQSSNLEHLSRTDLLPELRSPLVTTEPSNNASGKRKQTKMPDDCSKRITEAATNSLTSPVERTSDTKDIPKQHNWSHHRNFDSSGSETANDSEFNPLGNQSDWATLKQIGMTSSSNSTSDMSRNGQLFMPLSESLIEQATSDDRFGSNATNNDFHGLNASECDGVNHDDILRVSINQEGIPIISVGLDPSVELLNGSLDETSPLTSSTTSNSSSAEHSFNRGRSSSLPNTKVQYLPGETALITCANAFNQSLEALSTRQIASDTTTPSMEYLEVEDFEFKATVEDSASTVSTSFIYALDGSLAQSAMEMGIPSTYNNINGYEEGIQLSPCDSFDKLEAASESRNVSQSFQAPEKEYFESLDRSTISPFEDIESSANKKSVSWGDLTGKSLEIGPEANASFQNALQSNVEPDSTEVKPIIKNNRSNSVDRHQMIRPTDLKRQLSGSMNIINVGTPTVVRPAPSVPNRRQPPCFLNLNDSIAVSKPDTNSQKLIKSLMQSKDELCETLDVLAANLRAGSIRLSDTGLLRTPEETVRQVLLKVLTTPSEEITTPITAKQTAGIIESVLNEKTTIEVKFVESKDPPSEKMSVQLLESCAQTDFDMAGLTNYNNATRGQPNQASTSNDHTVIDDVDDVFHKQQINEMDEGIQEDAAVQEFCDLLIDMDVLKKEVDEVGDHLTSVEPNSSGQWSNCSSQSNLSVSQTSSGSAQRNPESPSMYSRLSHRTRSYFDQHRKNLINLFDDLNQETAALREKIAQFPLDGHLKLQLVNQHEQLTMQPAHKSHSMDTLSFGHRDRHQSNPGGSGHRPSNLNNLKRYGSYSRLSSHNSKLHISPMEYQHRLLELRRNMESSQRYIPSYYSPQQPPPVFPVGTPYQRYIARRLQSRNLIHLLSPTLPSSFMDDIQRTRTMATSQIEGAYRQLAHSRSYHKEPTRMSTSWSSQSQARSAHEDYYSSIPQQKIDEEIANMRATLANNTSTSPDVDDWRNYITPNVRLKREEQKREIRENVKHYGHSSYY